ncbi:SpaA isopeptide-forming pilin-related protein [uncultured Anaerococcus sp.]|uniref:MSCRAMM family protein n=1 Tax=uncultured Anaerococcus sp. TaxID=293428 RepID=UPI002803E125|nr:SpaA isopeptide-forming pilin-related protein [uncultured Anaerococcus sp.]
MKNILKTKYISFLLALVMVVGIFLPCGGALYKENGKYSIDIGIKINEMDKLKKEVKEGGIIKSSGRQVKVYKLKADKGLTDKEMFDLAQSLHKSGEKEVSIKDAEDKLKEKKLFDKYGVLSEKSKLLYDGKLVDEIKLNKGDDPELAKLTEENITIKDLEEGYYLIKETDASKKISDEKLNTFVVKLSDKTVNDKKVRRIEAKVTEKIPTDRIVLIKEDVDNSNIKLNQVEFELYRKDKDGDKVVTVDGSTGAYIYKDKGKTSSLITNDDGKIVVENVPEGKYYFKEKTPHPGYDKANIGNKSEEVSPGGTVTVKNKMTPILRKVNAKKKDEYLKEAVFKVFTEDNKALKFKKTGIYYEQDSNGKEEIETDSNGAIYISDLKPGKYFLEEVKAPEGYILSKNRIEFKIKDFRYVNKDGKLDVMIVENEPKTPTNPKTPTGGFNFVKIDSTKNENRLGGAKFILMKKVGSNFEKFLVNGKEVKLTSKDNGEFAIDGLEYGEYALKEVEAPKNHTITNELTPFTVDAASSSLPAKKIVNEPYTPRTIVSKTNTITTKYTPSDITRIVKSPLVKTGDIRIVVMAIVGLILLMMGIKLVNSGERMQRI